MLTEQQKMLTLLKMGKDVPPKKSIEFKGLTMTDLDSFESALSLSILTEEEKQIAKNRLKTRNMLQSHFEPPGVEHKDVIQQYAEDAELIPNLEDIPITRYPWGDTPIQMPSNVAFKALQVIILGNPEKYNISKKLVDEFKDISYEYDEATTKIDKDRMRTIGREFYKKTKYMML